MVVSRLKLTNIDSVQCRSSGVENASMVEQVGSILQTADLQQKFKGL